MAGPEGVGKQRLALWSAQLLLCEAPGASPAARAGACRLVLGLGHADLHWIVPIPRPKAGEPDKQMEEAAESIAELHGGAPEGAALHAGRRHVGAWDGHRAPHRPAGRPDAGRRAGSKVFILGEAERLVAQESSPEAANALLKLFEEPPAETYFVLTSADPGRLLPTIRSRTVPLRVGPAARRRCARVSGGRARSGPDGSRTRPVGGARRRVDRRGAAGIGCAASRPGRRPRHGSTPSRAVQARPPNGRSPRRPWSARGEFTDLLDAVAEALGDAARGAVGAGAMRPVPAALAGADPARLLDGACLVTAAREAAQGNVNPQLLLAVLAGDLAEAL